MRQLRLLGTNRRKRRMGRPKKKDAGVSHLARPALASRFPVHVTLKVKEGVWRLRDSRCYKALRRAFADGHEKEGFRLVHYCVEGNHLHFIVEAHDKIALAHGLQGLNIRMAKA